MEIFVRSMPKANLGKGLVPILAQIITPLFLILSATAGELRVAVASNFTAAFKALALRHEQQTGQTITPIPGASGKHYAQIKNGAPFDAFFAADAQGPQRLESEGRAVAGSRFTYALGKLALWSPTANTVDPAGKVLQEGAFSHLALANPDLAPYGRAARQVLQHLHLWQTLKGKLVFGENISQTFNFVQTGNAQLGFIAWSQIDHPTARPAGSWWEIPPNLHDPIEQQAILLKPIPAAMIFFQFVQSPQGQAIILEHGYALPHIR
ncbi:MAG: molybdenum ABC transporter substrate-binding protein [Magnetococcales bacterium]|nr:molybdenum ABC transporter substrate-binding protein [Magnetococcales bacterium]